MSREKKKKEKKLEALVLRGDIIFSVGEKASVVPLAVPVLSCGNKPLGGTY